MKLNFGKKLVLLLHWLYSLLVCVVAVALCISPQLAGEAAAAINSLLGPGLAMAAGIVLLAIYALLAILAIAAVFPCRNKRADRSFITVDSSDTGRTRIAIGAVDQMIRQAVRGVDGITDMKSVIENNIDSISITCNVSITNGAHVPTVTMNIQRAIRSYIELNCGVAVREVSVSVNALDDGEGKGRRKAKNAAPAASIPAAPVFVPEPVREIAPEPVPAAEAEPELPETEPISLTLDPPAAAEEAPAEEIQAEE